MSMCHGPNPADMERGAYLLLEPHKGLADCALIVDEADSATAQRAGLILSVQGIVPRLIAVRDFALFEQQDEDYRNTVLRPNLTLYAAVSENCPWLQKVQAVRFDVQDANSLANCLKAHYFAE